MMDLEEKQVDFNQRFGGLDEEIQVGVWLQRSKPGDYGVQNGPGREPAGLHPALCRHKQGDAGGTVGDPLLRC